MSSLSTPRSVLGVDRMCRAEINEAFEASVFANSLQNAGYQTGMIGKYLNGKKVSHCPTSTDADEENPPGWDFYFAM